MQANIVYNTPPIKEAVITLTLNKAMALEELNIFASNAYFTEKYPLKKPMFHYSVQMAANAKPAIDELVQGYSLECGPTCFKVIKVTDTQIALHNFTNYIGWVEMETECKTIWQILQEIDKNLHIQSLNVRYVNQIEIPLPLTMGLEEYLTILPTLPKNAKPLDNFFIQLQNASDDNSMQSIINQTIINKNKGSLTVLLDIAVIKKNIENMDTSFQDIRSFKNELFESALTETTKQLFN